MIRSIIDGMLFAFSYFTVIPTFKHELKIDKTTYSSMLFFTPFCGAIIAMIAVYVAISLNHFYAPLYSILLGSILYLCLYGFLHLEAIADVVDAWMAKYSKKDIYEIMKEPQIGAIGAIGTFCFILLKLAAIVYLLLDEKFFMFIVIVILSRFSILYNLRIFTFHANSIFATSLKQSSTWLVLILATLFYALIVLYLIDVKSVIILLVVSVFSSIVILNILKRRFGFLNGDCIGFSIEFTELMLLNVGLLL